MNKLYRSTSDAKIMGLCGGLAEKWHMDATLLRLFVAGTAFFSGGTVIPLYFIAAIIIPKEPSLNYSYGPAAGEPYGPQFGYPGSGFGDCKNDWNRQGGAAPDNGNGAAKTDLDSMMKDLETKAMKKQLEELRVKLAQYENKKGDE